MILKNAVPIFSSESLYVSLLMIYSMIICFCIKVNGLVLIIDVAKNVYLIDNHTLLK